MPGGKRRITTFFPSAGVLAMLECDNGDFLRMWANAWWTINNEYQAHGLFVLELLVKIPRRWCPGISSRWGSLVR
ncbi:hypothetical protein RRF57_009979 [Xylaria bambusicola]|uniref:Uncharacterized protein n=1 Tax=Xylaria bambusicola TaxID=326684 RepID=A0AAN7Z2B5_9PEZI